METSFRLRYDENKINKWEQELYTDSLKILFTEFIEKKQTYETSFFVSVQQRRSKHIKQFFRFRQISNFIENWPNFNWSNSSKLDINTEFQSIMQIGMIYWSDKLCKKSIN